MVSRQETARPLLTPGEVMQLPPDDELVLISGCHPIRAKKARYYEDRQLQSRILPPPTPTLEPDAISAADPLLPRHGDDQWTQAIVPPTTQAEDPDNAGIRREPELPEHEEILTEPRKAAQEFELADDDPEDDAQSRRVLQRRTRALARQVALDPDDGMRL
jgi:type IV secretion system protein VirD4